MVGFLTYGNKKFYELDSKMRELIPPLYKAMKDLMQFVDADAAAYSVDFIDVTDQSSPFFSFLLCNVDLIKGADISLHL